MSEGSPSASVLPPKEDPENLALRARPRPVVRFRRGLIIGTMGSLAAAIVAISWFALDPPSLKKAASAIEIDDSEDHESADTLAALPKNYGDVPRLGPPLPGDLGRPILEQNPGLAGADSSGSPGRRGSELELERERERNSRIAALSSPIIVQLDGQAIAAAVPAGAPATRVAGELTAPSAEFPMAQQRKLDFTRPANDGVVNAGRLQLPSPWTVSAGSIIPASLITGLNSDLPGIVIAQVTENVRDSATGRTILIPQGARLIGRYDSAVAYGQRRALLVWTRMLFPNGTSVELDNMPATDSAGFAGLEDKVDSHGWQLLKGIVLSTLLGVGTQISLGNEGTLVRAIGQSAEQNAAHSGDQLTSRNLAIQPTIRVRPGWPVRLLVTKDLVLEPWKG